MEKPHNPDFTRFWIGETISMFGSAITELALPLTAVVVLKATPAQMGVLSAASYAPFLLIGLLAGVWVDRARRRPILLSADIAKALLLGSIPVAAMLGRLDMSQILLVAFLTGGVRVIDDVAYQAFLPSLLRRKNLVDGNSKLEVSNSIAGIAGPGIAGFLVQILTAPIAIAVDAFSFVISALFLVSIRSVEPPPTPHGRESTLMSQIRDGLRVIFSNAFLRAIMWCGTMHNFFSRMIDALFVLYASRELALSPAMVGVVMAFGGPGALVGSLLVSRLTKRFGIGRTLVFAQVLTGISRLLIPLAGGSVPATIAVLASSEFLWGLARPMFNITQISLRQSITPDHMLGRMNASIRFVMWSVTPFGALLGGVLGGYIGLQATMLLAATGVLGATAWMYFSPVRTLKE